MTTQVRFRAGDEERLLGVAGGRFVEASGQTPDLIDLTDMTVLPGLVDAHAHFAANSIDELRAMPPTVDVDRMIALGRRKLEAGVLAALDKGFKSDASLAYLDVDPHRRPHVEMAGGMIASPGGYYEGYGMEVDDAGLESAVQARLATRASWVKLVADWPRKGEGPRPNFSEDALRTAVAAAHAQGRRVAVHTMAPDAPGMAVRAGVDSIEHGLFLTEEDLDDLGRRRGAWVPTIAAVENLVDFLGADSGGGRLLRQGLDRVRRLLPSAFETGALVLAGTDLSLPHGRLAAEAAALSRYGLGPERAVRAASWAGYEHLGVDPLRAGAPADLVAYPVDPADNVDILARPTLVMRRGRVVVSR
jgi:imidazolonepropionase-like amidohydrolase